MSIAMLMGAGIDISVKALASDYATAQIVLLSQPLLGERVGLDRWPCAGATEPERGG